MHITLRRAGIRLPGQPFVADFVRTTEATNTAWSRHGVVWTAVEYDILVAEFCTGKSLKTICHVLERSPAGVIPKLESLGLIRVVPGLGDYSRYVCDQRPVDSWLYQRESVRDVIKKLCEVPELSTQLTQLTQPTKEPTMAAAKTIESKTFILGQDAEGMTDQDIFNLIAKTEKEIAALNAIQSKPKKLTSKIEEMQKDIDKLVKFVDER